MFFFRGVWDPWFWFSTNACDKGRSHDNFFYTCAIKDKQKNMITLSFVIVPEGSDSDLSVSIYKNRSVKNHHHIWP
jgi:hypothetical protein